MKKQLLDYRGPDWCNELIKQSFSDLSVCELRFDFFIR